MTDALIGATSFVGSNLLRQHAFDDCFASEDPGQIRGRSFDLIVVAAYADHGTAAVEPERDLDEIERLIHALSGADARKVVLVSTVDVFLDPSGVDEDSPTPIEGLHAYGRHRRRLEELVTARFDAHVVRLPSLYGPGLTEGVLCGFLNDADTESIDSRAILQFYDVSRLWSDIEIAMNNELPVVHLTTEPVSVAELARTAFGTDFHNEVAERPARYDVRTLYATLFGGEGKYVEDKPRELARISEFVRQARE